MQITKIDMSKLTQNSLRGMRSPSAPITEMQIILKTAERCNLACSYCYYFYLGDESFADRDPIIKPNIFFDIANFLAQGVKDLSLKKLQIVFHGGEPTLQKPHHFDQLCTVFRREIGAITSLFLGIQTNGFHITDEWLDLFEKHQVAVGVSIDGGREHHDKYRKDHKGNGSFDKILSNIKRIDERVKQGKIQSLGFLCVLNASYNPTELIDLLAVITDRTSIGFLLPDRSHDTVWLEGESPAEYGKRLCEIFDAWVKHGGRIGIREIEQAVNFFQLHAGEFDMEKQTKNHDFSFLENRNNEIVVVQSNGEVSIDDSLIPALEWRKSSNKSHVRSGRLSDFIANDDFMQIRSARRNLPSECKTCRWRSPCRGGVVENRFSKARGFDNPSVYCESWKVLFSHIESYLLSNGYPSAVFEQKLAA
jgi:uncharacterized protein